MKKAIVGLTAAVALTAATLTPAPVKADPISAWWLLPAFLGGMFVASTVHRPAHAAPRAQYYGPVGPAPRAHYYAPRGQAYMAAPPRDPYAPRAQVRARY